MGLIEAIILGIIQGLTEFLPVSSSGHLEIANAIFGHETGEENLLMTVTLHAATALATVLVPAAFVGLVYEDAIEALFSGNLLLVGCMLIITGLLLFLADRAKNTDKQVSYAHAFIIGVSQAIAILPGISRSGATISTSVLLGIDRGRAARFSFLMVVPLILGKMAKDILDGAFVDPDVNLVAIMAGFAAAFITGYFACTWMIALVKKAKLSWFSIYCILVGIVAILWSLQ